LEYEGEEASAVECASDTHAGNRPLTPARGDALASPPNDRHMRAMPGSPLKRQRRLGVRLEDGSVIAFPRMPRVANLPLGWRHFPVAQKIEHLIGFDQAREILSWPMAELDPLRLSLKMPVIGVVLRLGIKPALAEAALERDRERVLAQMAREFRALKAADAQAR